MKPEDDADGEKTGGQIFSSAALIEVRVEVRLVFRIDRTAETDADAVEVIHFGHGSDDPSNSI